MRREMEIPMPLVFTIFIMAALAVLRETAFFPVPDLIPNPDNSWLIYAAGRMLEGQKLYVDILETNPPLIVWLNALPVLLGKLLHISPFIAFPFLVTLLNIASLWLVASIMRGQEFFKEKPAFCLVLLYIAFAFFLFSPAVYGQRELLFIALALPYLFYSLDGEKPRKPARNMVIISMAALGFAIKPFFLLLWVMNELHIAAGKHSIKSLFAWHNWVIGFAQLAYFALIYYLTPEYITDILPELKVTYFTFNAPWENIISPLIKVALAARLVVWLANLQGEYLRVGMRVVTWLGACVGFLFLQRKSWINHLYPMTFMAGLALTISLLYLVAEWKKLRLDIGYRKFIALSAAACMLTGSVYLDGVFSYNMFAKPSKLSKKLMAEIEDKAAGKYVYPLGNNLQPAFPAIALSHGVFRGGFHHLWPIMGLLIREQQGDNSPELAKARKWFLDKLVRDFTLYPPELVWVDDNVNLEVVSVYPVKPENRDIIRVLSQDARFAEIWRNYEKYKEIESEAYPDEEAAKTAEEKLKKPEHYSLYIRKNNI
jgi:hypothetical protein